jgi:hypothetical protein
MESKMIETKRNAVAAYCNLSISCVWPTPYPCGTQAGCYLTPPDAAATD